MLKYQNIAIFSLYQYNLWGFSKAAIILGFQTTLKLLSLQTCQKQNKKPFQLLIHYKL